MSRTGGDEEHGLTRRDRQRAQAFLDSDSRHPAALAGGQWYETVGPEQMTVAECHDNRLAAVRGASVAELAVDSEWCDSTIRHHLCGSRDCEHDLPPLVVDPVTRRRTWAPKAEAAYPACACDANPDGTWTVAHTDGVQFRCVVCGRVWLPDAEGADV